MKVFFTVTMGLIMALGSYSAHSDQCKDERIEEMKLWDKGSEFFSNHSEKEMIRILDFVDNPSEHLKDILDIENWCSYIQNRDWFLFSVKHSNEGCFMVLMRNLNEATRANIESISHLILTGKKCGYYLEALSTRYTQLFLIRPDLFIEDLKVRQEWKDLIQLLQVGDWDSFKTGLAKLGNSAFEISLKAYVREIEFRK